MINIILISIGIALYFVIAGIVDAHFDLGPGCILWPLMLPIIGCLRLGYTIYEYFEGQQWKKLIDNDKKGESDGSSN